MTYNGKPLFVDYIMLVADHRLSEEDEERMAKYETYLEQIQFLDSKWQKRQRLRDEKMSNNQTSMAKASYKWVGWMLSWVWIGV